MATERPTFSRTQRLASLLARGVRRRFIVRRGSALLPMVLFVLVLVLTPLGNVAQRAQAASARPQDSCPTSYSNGGAGCSGAVTEVIPGNLQPPGGSVFPWDSWWTCVSTRQLSDWIYANDGPNAWRIWDIVDDVDNNLWDGNWDILVNVLPDGQMLWGGYTPHGVTQQQIWASTAPASWPNPRPPCPPPQPPCLTCAPQIQVTYFDFWAYAPRAVVSGYADCSHGSPAGSWCPPSVGNPVHLWVSGFTSSQGRSEACSDLGTYGGLYGDYTICMRWIPSLQVNALAWDFDDEHIDPTSGQGQQISGVNYGVDTAVGQQIAHTFEYSSAFNPIRQCVRPCQGDMTGPPMAGYPNGTPAFQVKVSSSWDLQVLQCVNGDCGAWQTIDLRQFGSPTRWFTSVTTTPLFVVSYGSVTP